MKTLLVCAALFIGLCQFSRAMPDPPIEDLLMRAEKVAVARVTAIGNGALTFKPLEVLRGEFSEELTISMEKGLEKILRIHAGSMVFLYSQGDARYGPPKPKFVYSTAGQMTLCGWQFQPISTIDGEAYVRGGFTVVDDKLFTEGPTNDQNFGLKLSRVKGLIERFPYNPHINDSR